VAAYYLCANRNKRSITVDITQPEGQDIVRRLAAKSDVVLENFKLGGLKQYGLDYDSLKAVNPRLVYCSITGFGQDGFVGEHAFHHRNARQVVAQRLALREDGGQLQMISGRSGCFRMIIGRGWHR